MTGICGKIIFRGYHSARQAIRGLDRKRRHEGPMHPYVCRACRGWHIGHQ